MGAQARIARERVNEGVGDARHIDRCEAQAREAWEGEQALHQFREAALRRRVFGEVHPRENDLGKSGADEASCLGDGRTNALRARRSAQLHGSTVGARS
ncbi:MAG: hypothetical protein NTV92_04225, partial [Candidatus Bipolaricaulota bacterium]|nr:hypothetical protein [Candidatus Bipolaricaulota bacterium]